VTPEEEQAKLSKLTLEQLVTGKGYADLPASPLQRAICRVADGLPLGELSHVAEVVQAFGGFEAIAALPRERPDAIELAVAIRSGKSFMAACKGIHAPLTADLRHLKKHEIVRSVILGPTTDVARATFVQKLGILESPILSRYVDGEPTMDTIMLRRPDGRRVEVMVVAAHKGGLSVRNRWLVHVTFEEVALFGEEAMGAAVNVEALWQAAITRLLPGCQAWLVGSPMGPRGMLHDAWKKHFGKPSRALVVVQASTRMMNPSFPQSKIDAIQISNPDAADEYRGTFNDVALAYYGGGLVDPAIRAAPLQRTGRAVAAGMDPGTRGNSWTLAVAWPERDPLNPARRRIIVSAVWSWTGSRAAPLSPRATLQEIARVLQPYGIKRIHVDSWSFDAMQDHAREVGLSLIEQPAGERDLPYQQLHTLLANGDVELPPEPMLRTDLLAVQQRATAGGVKIYLPQTANGRHCDYVPAVALAVTYAAGTNISTFIEAMRLCRIELDNLRS
jgi:hypothetical protein